MTSARTVFRVSTLFPVSVIMYVSDRWVIFEVDKLKLKEKLKRYVYKECKAVLHSVAAVRCGPVRVVNSRSTREIKFTPVQTDATRKRTRDGLSEPMKIFNFDKGFCGISHASNYNGHTLVLTNLPLRRMRIMTQPVMQCFRVSESRSASTSALFTTTLVQ